MSNRSRLSWLSSWWALAACLAASSARAEAPTHALADPDRPHRLWIRTVAFAEGGSDTTVAIAPRFGAAFLLADRFDLDVEIPLLLATTPDSSGGALQPLPGNPFVGLAHVTEERGYRLRAGLGITAPLARDKASDAIDQVAYRVARASRGGREGWLYTADYLAIVLSTYFEHHIAHGPIVAADVAMALMPRVYGDGKSFLGTTQVGLAVGAELAEVLRLGGRFDLIFLPDTELTRLQTALVPFLQLSAKSGALFSAEMIFNLNDPYGASFRRDRFWGLSLLAGSRF